MGAITDAIESEAGLAADGVSSVDEARARIADGDVAGVVTGYDP
ncbi:hypothetical protein [Halobaculum litoreum]|uniref:Uncharacterized protein n=1 Tax=Halobaculum litoreum TaxID=3031998 RepID=A0ABD5XT90_9EURY|nr:hypothetical protein [Halobaculum sp. DT92]